MEKHEESRQMVGLLGKFLEGLPSGAKVYLTIEDSDGRKYALHLSNEVKIIEAEFFQIPKTINLLKPRHSPDIDPAHHKS